LGFEYILQRDADLEAMRAILKQNYVTELSDVKLQGIQLRRSSGNWMPLTLYYLLKRILPIYQMPLTVIIRGLG